MTWLTLVRKNLFERRVRTLLLGFSIVIAFLIFGLLNGFANMSNAFENPESQNRLMTINRTGLLQSLPSSYADRVRNLEGVRQVVGIRFFGGYIDQRHDSVPLLMADAEAYLAASPVEGLSARARAAFLSQRDGVIVDEATAAQRGWKVGDRITVRSLLHINAERGEEWSFTVTGTFPAKGADGPQAGMLGHITYLDENVVAGRDFFNWLTVVTTTPSMGGPVARRIDGLFQNSAYETTTMSETAMAQAFISQVADLTLIVNLVVGAAFLALLIGVANTTALTIRQRTRQIGTLKAIGYTPIRILRMILVEVATLSIGGAFLGLLLAGWLLGSALRGMRLPAPELGLPTATIIQGAVMALLLAMITGIPPAVRAMRINPSKAFGRE